jgi:hypothetical protein
VVARDGYNGGIGLERALVLGVGRYRLLEDAGEARLPGSVILLYVRSKSCFDPGRGNIVLEVPCPVERRSSGSIGNSSGVRDDAIANAVCR